MSEAADIRGGGGTVPWREIAAGHEAGHAVVAWHYGARIDLVTVVPFTTDDGTEAGGCVKAAGLRSRRAEAACDLGGYAANITLQRVPADAAWRAAGEDVRRLRDAGVPEDAWTVYIGATSDILTRRRRQWERLCTRLLTADSLSWREAADILGPPRCLRCQVGGRGAAAAISPTLLEYAVLGGLALAGMVKVVLKCAAPRGRHRHLSSRTFRC